MPYDPVATSFEQCNFEIIVVIAHVDIAYAHFTRWYHISLGVLCVFEFPYTSIFMPCGYNKMKDSPENIDTCVEESIEFYNVIRLTQFWILAHTVRALCGLKIHELYSPFTCSQNHHIWYMFSLILEGVVFSGRFTSKQTSGGE